MIGEGHGDKWSKNELAIGTVEISESRVKMVSNGRTTMTNRLYSMANERSTSIRQHPWFDFSSSLFSSWQLSNLTNLSPPKHHGWGGLGGAGMVLKLDQL